MKQKYENGRSMIEVLGVLAVIGVLSIGGIAGYSYGIDKYTANETVKGLTARAMDIQSQIDRCSEDICDVSIDGWDSEPTPLPIVLEDDGLLHINKVPPRICQMIGDMLINSAAVYVENLKYNSQKDPCYAGENVSMWFSFDPEDLADFEDDDEFTAPARMTTENEKMTTEIEEVTDQTDMPLTETITAQKETVVIETENTWKSDSFGDMTETNVVYTERPEIDVCPSVEGSAEECNSDEVIDLNAITDRCLKDRVRGCGNRELQGNYSIKRCDYWDAYSNGWQCPEVVYSEVVSSEYTEVITTVAGEETTLFPVKPDIYSTAYPETDITSVTLLPETTIVIPDPTELMARLKRDNSSCPTPYYDSITQTVYYYAEWDLLNKCAVRVCNWDTYANDWMCQM